MSRIRRKQQELVDKRFILLGGAELAVQAIYGSLVIDLLSIFRRHGINNDYISGLSLTPATIKGLPEIIRKKRVLEQTAKVHVYLLPRIPHINTWFRKASILLQAVSLFIILLKDIVRGQEVIILARALEAPEIAVRLKKISRKISVITLLEAEGSAEYEYSHQRKGVSPNSKKIRNHVAYLDKVEKEIILGSDRICCVSEALKKHLAQKHHLDTSNVEVLPNSADSSIFLFNEEIRKKTRERLGLQNKFVFVYSGAMHAWQMFPAMLRIFKGIKSVEKQAYFLILTPFVDEAMKHINESGLTEKEYTLLSIEHHEMSQYLAAADMGFLIRENHLLNAVSSPVKFSEYVLCGLPVMMTEGIGDYSDFMKEHNFGVILHDFNNREEITRKFTVFKAKGIDSNERYKFSKYAEGRFSRQSHIHKLLDIYSSVAGIEAAEQ